MTGIEPPDPHVISHWLAQILALVGLGAVYVRGGLRRRPRDGAGR
jgi:hypothetical protein